MRKILKKNKLAFTTRKSDVRKARRQAARHGEKIKSRQGYLLTRVPK